MSYKIGGKLEPVGMVKTDKIINTNNLFQKETTKTTKTTIKNDIIDSSSLTEEFIKKLLNSTEYQQKRTEERKNIEKNKKFKTVNISPNISYIVFDQVKIVDMTPPIGMSIDDYE
jgi:hypothetical protein